MPGGKTAADVLEAYIDQLIVENKGAPHSDEQMIRLKDVVEGALSALKNIVDKSLLGVEGASTGPSPADDQVSAHTLVQTHKRLFKRLHNAGACSFFMQVGLYKDFKQFIKARVAGGVQSEDRQKILYLEAQISELQGYLQSNSVDRIRLIAKIHARFMKDANGPESMKGRRRAWISKIADIKKYEAILEDSRIKLGKARVAEAMLREQVQRDKGMLATMQQQEDASQAAAREAAVKKYNEQKQRAEDKDKLARERLNIAQDIQYQGAHNHAAAASAPAPAPKKRRANLFVDNEAKEGNDEDEDMKGYD